MPSMPIREIVFFAGCVLIIIAMVGGGIAAKGVSVGKIGPVQRGLIAAFGTVLCLAAFLAPLDKLVIDSAAVQNSPLQPSVKQIKPISKKYPPVGLNAQATKLDGTESYFPADNVVAVSDHNLWSGGEAVTTVIGISSSPIRIRGSVDDFISTLDNKADFFSISTINGNVIWINARHIKSIRKADPVADAPKVKTVIEMDKMMLGVAFDIEDVKSLVNSHGGHV